MTTRISILTLLLAIASAQIVSAQCERLPNGSWSCPTDLQAAPTAMDIRVECPTTRGSGTAVARLASGGTVIVTNHHVVRGQTRIDLRSSDGRTAAGQLLHVDVANDLALVAVRERWPIVTLGHDIALGSAVQFRAFNRGTNFRRYTGRVVSEYSEAGAADGYFATGASVEGNSGGGVYAYGKLVGVIWGNPSGQTAFVRIGPVRRLLARLRSAPNRTPNQQQPSRQELHRQELSRPSLPASPQPSQKSCDCEERWAALLEKLDAQLKNIEHRTPNIERRTQSDEVQQGGDVMKGLSWGKVAAGALGVSGPIGLGIAVAGGLIGWRRKQQRKQQRRGTGGPRGDPFREETTET